MLRLYEMASDAIKSTYTDIEWALRPNTVHCISEKRFKEIVEMAVDFGYEAGYVHGIEEGIEEEKAALAKRVADIEHEVDVITNQNLEKSWDFRKGRVTIRDSSKKERETK